MFSNSPPPKYFDVYEIMWKNFLEPERPQMKGQYGACALHAGYLSLQTHTENM